VIPLTKREPRVARNFGPTQPPAQYKDKQQEWIDWPERVICVGREDVRILTLILTEPVE
jgi:hypothetical protein